jgi:hypothetical protein
MTHERRAERLRASRHHGWIETIGAGRQRQPEARDCVRSAARPIPVAQAHEIYRVCRASPRMGNSVTAVKHELAQKSAGFTTRGGLQSVALPRPQH